MKENVRLQLLEKESKFVYRIGVDHEVNLLYEKLLRNHHNHGVQLLVDILKLVYDNSKFCLDGAEISNSTEFFSFQRVTGGHFVSNFIEDAVNILIDDFLKEVDSERVELYLAEFAHSEHEGFVFITLYVYTEFPEKFKDNIF